MVWPRFADKTKLVYVLGRVVSKYRRPEKARWPDVPRFVILAKAQQGSFFGAVPQTKVMVVLCFVFETVPTASAESTHATYTHRAAAQQKHTKQRKHNFPIIGAVPREPSSLLIVTFCSGYRQMRRSSQEKAELSRIAAQPFARFQPDEKYMQEL